MKAWKLIYGSTKKENLWYGIWNQVLLRDNPILLDKKRFKDKAWRVAYKEMMDALCGRKKPKYIIGDAADRNGDYPVIDADTGRVQPFVVKHLESCGIWACVEYHKNEKDRGHETWAASA